MFCLSFCFHLQQLLLSSVILIVAQNAYHSNLEMTVSKLVVVRHFLMLLQASLVNNKFASDLAIKNAMQWLTWTKQQFAPWPAQARAIKCANICAIFMDSVKNAWMIALYKFLKFQLLSLQILMKLKRLLSLLQMKL